MTVGGRRTHMHAEFEGWVKRRKSTRRISFSGLREGAVGGSETSGREEKREEYVLARKTKRDREA